MGLKTERFRRPGPEQANVRVRPLFDDFYLLKMTGEMEYPRHRHSNYELILIEKGSYGCELNERELTLEPGQILVIKPGDWHQDHLRNGQRHYVLQFRLMRPEPGVPVAPLFRDNVLPAQQICVGDFSRERMLLRELRIETSNGDVHACAIQDSLLEALFWRVVRGFPADVLSWPLRQLPKSEVRREEISSVFSKFISRNPNVSELAEALRVSPRTLVSICHALFSETPARLLLQFKLRRADDLLNFQGMRVREVSDELGFSNPYHFSRVYRRLRGRPPSSEQRKAAGPNESQRPWGPGDPVPMPVERHA